MTPVKILHFADAHIDIYSGGRRDPNSGLPVHALDFLSALDQIVDTAIAEKVDLVLFAGDAYRNASPVPTFQKEWGKRMMRLSTAGIQTVLIPGNHDVSPAVNRANAIQEIDTYEVPCLHLAHKVQTFGPRELNGLPVQVLAVPFIPRAKFLAQLQNESGKPATTEEQNGLFLQAISERIRKQIEAADPELPLILLAHYTVAGVVYPSHQTASLGSGKELTLPVNLVKDPAFAYTALGHIHKYQNMNEGYQPPVIYSGSIEHVNYGEVEDPKGFVLASVEPHHAEYEFRRLRTRPMYDLNLTVQNGETAQQEVLDALEAAGDGKDAMIKLSVNIKDEWAQYLNLKELRDRFKEAMEFRLDIHRTKSGAINFGGGETGPLTQKTPMELVELYLTANQVPEKDQGPLKQLAAEIISSVNEA